MGASIDIHDIGLSVLHEPSDSIADIVFVHGLQGHPRRTWTTKKIRAQNHQSKDVPNTASPSQATTTDESRRSLRNIFSRGKTKARVSQTRPTEQEVYWPLDLLPNDCNNTRIFTWGYDSVVAKFFRGPTNKNNIFAYAKDLLYLLSNKRLDCKGRPLVFIAHSMGGIIVKDVIRRAAIEPDKNLNDIYLSTIAIFFLGTPHRGSQMGELGEVVRRIVSAVGFSTNDQSIRNLQINSSDLEIIHEGFISLYERPDRHFEVCTFQEAQGMTGVSYGKLDHKVVENISSILTGSERIQTINANHMSMCRFADRTEDGYQKVVGELQRCLSLIKVKSLVRSTDNENARLPSRESPSQKTFASSAYSLNETERLCISLFNKPDILEYQSTLPSRVEGTCEWVLSNSQYVRWLSEKEACLLWVSGHSGSGKTILSAFLLEYLGSSISSTGTKLIVCCFFCDEKIEAQRDAKAIIRSLIYQIIVRRRVLIKHVKAAYDMQGAHLTDNFNELWRIFTAITNDRKAGHINVIVDAIDECEENTRDRLLRAIASFVGQKSSSGTHAIKFLITSRPLLWRQYALARERTGHTLSIENLGSNNESDLHLVIRTRIDAIVRRTQCRPETREFLEHALYSRADQTFLWVTVILHILERTYLASQHDFQRIINKLPKGLTATYERFLLSIPSDYQDIANKLLHFIVGSMRSLSLDELRILLAIQPHHRNLEQVEKECQPNISETIQGILGPLVRISDNKVSLVHQSAKEFLQNLWTRKDNPLSQVFGVEIEKANFLLTEATMSYLLLEDFAVDKFAYATDIDSPGGAQPENKDTVWDAFELEEDITLQEIEYTSYHTYQDIADAHTLFDYSARYWPEHYSRSGSAKISVFKSAFSLLNMSQNCSKNWFRYFWFFTEPEWLYPSNFDTLIAACYFGFVEILDASLARDYKNDQTITETAMYWASRKGNMEIIDVLRTRIWHGINVSIALHPLIVAAQFGCLEVAKLLLNLDKIDPNVQGIGGRDSLSLAASNGHIDIVKTLLEDSRVKLDVQDVNKWTPFFWAVGGKHLDIVQLFSRNPGTNINHVDKRGRNVLSWAAESGETQIVKHLLTIDQLHCQNQDLSGRDALSWAAAAGHLEVIKLLLESRKLKVSGKDKDQRNAISWAAGGGHYEVVDYLIKCNGTGADAEDVDGWTPLAWALEKSDPRTVQVLLSSGKVDANRKDKSGRTPLSWAAALGLEDIVRVIVDVEGIDIYARDIDDQTPISRAEAFGYVNIVDILKNTRKDGT